MVTRVYTLSVPVDGGEIPVEIRADSSGIGWAADWLTEEQGQFCKMMMDGLSARGMLSSFCHGSNLELLRDNAFRFGYASVAEPVMSVLFALRSELIARGLVEFDE